MSRHEKRVDPNLEIEEARQRFEEERRLWIKAVPVAAFANELADRLCAEGMDVHTSGSFGWLSHHSIVIEVQIEDGQTIKAVKPIVEEVALSRRWKPARFSGDEILRILPTVTWKFAAKESGGVDLMVRAWIRETAGCEIVETGETHPVTKLVCPTDTLLTKEAIA